ncbi:MAG: DUF4276 family protein [Desulfofustis sp. PB-SRB1]|jgi:hypothetical protein|nr:DUF4276 family protein [Desulfofustis sp. PB-SRB1]MBM1001164.1 DUF4276 family protein [Desulfofustis sp. PB-SRB1]HBH29393.1 DUF4276 domain-containing protein [Desulfofustis sp.]HBH30541.1 DUF4276 domain-containing protein [Desulfofustis sp.]
MSSYAEVVVLVEGPTEQRFVKHLLAPYLADRSVYLTPIILDKPGERGGDVKFARAKNDIGRHLKQRRDTWITLLVDYYGIRGDWPGYAESKRQIDHTQKAAIMNQATAEQVQQLFPKQNQSSRFIPYVSMYEIEALYFSDPACIAKKLGVARRQVDAILEECKEPEQINDHSTKAPSKRLDGLSDRFKKTSTGIAIAEEIGICKMREACPLFDAWLTKLESLVESKDGEA